MVERVAVLLGTVQFRLNSRSTCPKAPHWRMLKVLHDRRLLMVQ